MTIISRNILSDDNVLIEHTNNAHLQLMYIILYIIFPQTIHGLELALNPHSMEGYITLWGIEFQEILINISVAVNTPSHTGYVSSISTIFF